MKTEHADGHSGIDNLAHIFFFGWCWCWLSFRYTQSTCLPTEQREEEEGGQEQRGEYYFQNMIYGLRLPPDLQFNKKYKFKLQIEVGSSSQPVYIDWNGLMAGIDNVGLIPKF
ncbi:hypothetical protein TWF225_001013 [Orbilia oligospora]|nr:hypothetical protein TWF225_001013 [Orbilia oligospora]